MTTVVVVAAALLLALAWVFSGAVIPGHGRPAKHVPAEDDNPTHEGE